MALRLREERLLFGDVFTQVVGAGRSSWRNRPQPGNATDLAVRVNPRYDADPFWQTLVGGCSEAAEEYVAIIINKGISWIQVRKSALEEPSWHHFASSPPRGAAVVPDLGRIV